MVGGASISDTPSINTLRGVDIDSFGGNVNKFFVNVKKAGFYDFYVTVSSEGCPTITSHSIKVQFY